ncbi:MAG TPA: RDD family protein [Thermoanaerobaculia bacterium]|nr:RDD family protein [Thermoanaerobaculia bacterium]
MICRNHVEATEGIRRCARCAVPFCPDCLVEISGRPYCATCKSEQLLDVRSGVDRSQLALATVWRRFAAIFIDNLLIIIPMYSIMAVLVFIPASQGKEPHPLMGFVGIPFALAALVYEGLMLQLKNGQTLGKMAMKIRVVRPDGTAISTGQAWGRVGLRTILGCLWIVDYIPVFFTDERTTLHDMAASTRVIDTY